MDIGGVWWMRRKRTYAARSIHRHWVQKVIAILGRATGADVVDVIIVVGVCSFVRKTSCSSRFKRLIDKNHALKRSRSSSVSLSNHQCEPRSKSGSMSIKIPKI
jgi:hypothetical protein